MFWDNLSSGRLLWQITAQHYLGYLARRQLRLDLEIQAWVALGYSYLDLTIVECKVCRWSWADLTRLIYPHNCPGCLDRRLVEAATDVFRPPK